MKIALCTTMAAVAIPNKDTELKAEKISCKRIRVNLNEWTIFASLFDIFGIVNPRNYEHFRPIGPDESEKYFILESIGC